MPTITRSTVRQPIATTVPSPLAHVTTQQPSATQEPGATNSVGTDSFVANQRPSTDVAASQQANINVLLAGISPSAVLSEPVGPRLDGDKIVEQLLRHPGDPLDEQLFDIGAALEAAGIAGRFQEDLNSVDEWRHVIDALGPEALSLWLSVSDNGNGYFNPMLQDAVSTWELCPKEAQEIVDSAVELNNGALAMGLVIGLINNPHLPEAEKRRYLVHFMEGIAPGDSGDLEVPLLAAHPVNAAKLLEAGVQSPSPRARAVTAQLLRDGELGIDGLPAESRQKAIHALLNDPDLSVRIEAMDLFWLGPDTSPSAQQAQLDLIADPKIVARERFRAIEASGWARERQDLWGMPTRATGALLDAQAEIVGRLLERAPNDSDISVLLTRAIEMRSVIGVHRVAAQKVVASTHLDDPTKLELLSKISAASAGELEEQHAVLLAAASFLVDRPALVEDLPAGLSDPLIGRVRNEPDASNSTGLQALLLYQFFTAEGLPNDLVGRLEFSDAERESHIATALEYVERGAVEAAARMAVKLSADPTPFVQPAIDFADPGLHNQQMGGLLTGIETLASHPDLQPDELFSLIKTGVVHCATNSARQALGGARIGGAPSIPQTLRWETMHRLLSRIADPRLTDEHRSEILRALADEAEPHNVAFILGELESLGLDPDLSRGLAQRAKAQHVSSSTISPPSIAASLSEQLRTLSPPARLAEKALSEPSRAETFEAVALRVYPQGIGQWLPADDYAPYKDKSAQEILAAEQPLTVPGLQAFVMAKGLDELSDAEFHQALAGLDTTGASQHETEPMRMLAFLTRGESYESLKNEFADSVPLRWDLADTASAAGADPIGVLLSETEGTSTFMKSICFNAASTSRHLDTATRQEILQSGFMTGQFAHTSLDTTQSALMALRHYDGDDLSFAAPLLFERAQRQATSFNIPAEMTYFSQLLSDERLPACSAVEIAMALLTTTSPDTRNEYNNFDRFGLHRQRPAAATRAVAIIDCILERGDLSSSERNQLEMAGHLMLERIEKIFELPERSARLAATLENAVGTAPLEWTRGSGPSQRMSLWSIGGLTMKIADPRPSENRDELPSPFEAPGGEIWIYDERRYRTAGPFPYAGVGAEPTKSLEELTELALAPDQ